MIFKIINNPFEKDFKEYPFLGVIGSNDGIYTRFYYEKTYEEVLKRFQEYKKWQLAVQNAPALYLEV